MRAMQDCCAGVQMTTSTYITCTSHAAQQARPQAPTQLLPRDRLAYSLPIVISTMSLPSTQYHCDVTSEQEL